MIGILGGTFDPVHYGHLRPALEVKEVFGLTEIRLLPSAHPPHREQPAATALMRVRMLELAIQNQSGFVIDTRELDRAGRSYMIDTLKSFRLEFPEQTLILFVGADAFKNLTNWHCWQQLFDYAHIVVMSSVKGSWASASSRGISRMLSRLDKMPTRKKCSDCSPIRSPSRSHILARINAFCSIATGLFDSEANVNIFDQRLISFKPR